MARSRRVGGVPQVDLVDECHEVGQVDEIGHPGQFVEIVEIGLVEALDVLGPGVRDALEAKRRGPGSMRLRPADAGVELVLPSTVVAARARVR